jgi:tRNA C32,U32 (ribose-2'-O)-methylase TrmJ
MKFLWKLVLLTIYWPHSFSPFALNAKLFLTCTQERVLPIAEHARSACAFNMRNSIDLPSDCLGTPANGREHRHGSACHGQLRPFGFTPCSAARWLGRGHGGDAGGAGCSDLSRLYATTARARGQAKVVYSAEEAVANMRPLSAAGHSVGVLFGPERTGLDNSEVALADAIISYPVNPAHPSLNLAHAVSLLAYVWRTAQQGSAAPFALEHLTPPATREMLFAFFNDLERALDEGDYFIPDGKRPVMSRNLRNIFHRMELSEADIRTLRGVVVALAKGRVRRTKL